MNKKTESKIARRIVRLVSKQLTEYNFTQTKPTFICKKEGDILFFFHFHKFSFAPSFRIHTGIRTIYDGFKAIHLNGICSSPDNKFGDFSENESSILLYSNKLAKYCVEEGLKWMDNWRNKNDLLNNSRSPLNEKEKKMLIKREVKNIEISYKLLGLK